MSDYIFIIILFYAPKLSIHLQVVFHVQKVISCSQIPSWTLMDVFIWIQSWSNDEVLPEISILVEYLCWSGSSGELSSAGAEAAASSLCRLLLGGALRRMLSKFHRHKLCISWSRAHFNSTDSPIIGAVNKWDSIWRWDAMSAIIFQQRGLQGGLA